MFVDGKMRKKIVLLTHPYKFDYPRKEFTKISKKDEKDWNPNNRIDNRKYLARSRNWGNMTVSFKMKFNKNNLEARPAVVIMCKLFDRN